MALCTQKVAFPENQKDYYLCNMAYTENVKVVPGCRPDGLRVTGARLIKKGAGEFYRFLTSVAHPSMPSPRLPTSRPSIRTLFMPGVSSSQL